MRALRLLVLATALAATPLAVGCGDDVPSVPTDAGRRDSGTPDGGAPDGGASDGSTPDGALPDGDVPDGGEGDGDVPMPLTCRVDPSNDLFVLGTDSPPRERDVALAAGPTRFGVAWSAGPGALDEIYFAELPDTGNLAGAMQVTSSGAITLDPVLAARGDDWVLAWYSNAAGDFDVFTATFEDGRLSTTAHRVTERTGRDDAPALLPTSEGTLLAWVEERASGTRRAVTRMLDDRGVPTGTPRDATAADALVTHPQLFRRSSGFALGWVDPATSSAVVQPLTSAGASTGALTTLSTEGNASGTLDVAANETGGAAVFGVAVATRAEVRARTIDGSGTANGPERVLTVGAESGRDASITRFAGGYAIAYRSIVGTTPTLRVALVSNTLDTVQVLDVTDVAPSGGRTTIRATAEGRLAVAWADVDATTTTIRAARVRCD